MDVTVRGAGIFGLTVAWEIAARGGAVQIVDPGGPGAGASGGVVGALAPHVPDGWTGMKALQFRSLIEARAFWPRIEAASGMDPGYARTGRLQPLADDAAVERARARAAAAARNWEGQAAWDVIRCEGTWLPPTPTGLCIRDTLSAHLHPRRAIAALAEALRRRGVWIVPEADDVGAVVHCTGAAGLSDLSEALGREIGRGIKGQAALLAFDAGRAAPQLFVEGLHVVPHPDGTIAIGSTTERDYDDAASTDARLGDVIDRARDLVPALADAPVLRRWAGLRPRARRRGPLLGAWPGRAGHFVANGGFKIGFGMAPAIATLMADLVLEGRDGIPHDMTFAANLG